MNFKKIYLFLFFASLSLTNSCMQESDIKTPFISLSPRLANDNWEIATLSETKIDSVRLVKIFRNFHEDESIWMARSLTVIRDGKLIAESYTKDDDDRYTPHAVWSCTKQILGLVSGLAIEKGLITSVEDSLYKYFPKECRLYPDKSNIQIKHLLTMSSGIDFYNSGYCSSYPPEFQEIPPSYLDLIFSFPMKYKPGEKFIYKNSDPMLLSIIIQEKSGMPTDEWAKINLFSKIGVSNIIWKRYRDGYTLGPYGIQTTPRELAKFGALMCNRGVFKNVRVIDESWLNEMETKGYGFLWKHNDVFYMSGSGGQLLVYNSNKKMAVVITSDENTQWGFGLPTEKGLSIADSIFSCAK